MKNNKKRHILKTWLLLTFLLVGAGSVWAEDTIIEYFEKQTAATTYDRTYEYSADESNVGISWFVEHGCVSETNKLQGNKSLHMRAYYLPGSAENSWKGKLPYTETRTPIKGLKSVSFISRVSDKRLVGACSYSTDGKVWTEMGSLSFSNTTNRHTFSFDIPNSDSEKDYYIKIELSTGSTHASKPEKNGNYTFRIDSVVFTSMKEDLYSYDANTRAAVFTNGEVTKTDVEKAVNKHPETTCVDLTHADVTGPEVDDIMTLFAGKNTVVITNAADATASNVVVKDAEGHYNCAKLELTDKSDFAPGVAFDASRVAYSRSNTTGYNTVCLPFRVAASDFGEGTRVYKLTGTEIVDHTTRITFDEANGIIEAGTPCLVDGGSTESWNMALTATSIAKEALDMEGTPSDDTTRPRLCGAFLGKALGEGCYKLNATGEKFVKTTAASTIMPFRFYLSLGDASSETKECGMRLIDESGRETYISDVLCPSGKSDAFDLNGRRVVRVTMPGVYVVGGKKVVR